MFRFILWIIRLLGRKKEEICYFNFSLPEPLSEEEEKKYLMLVQEGNVDARNILVEHNMRLVVFIAKRFDSPKTTIEDLVSIGAMGLIKGVETFKLDKNIKLATYASRCIENEILMFLRKNSKMKNEISLEDTLNVDSDGNELLLEDVLANPGDLICDEMIKVERERIMYEAISRLKPRERQIISMRFGLFGEIALTQKEVAITLGISQSYISRLEKKIFDKLKEDMEKKLAVSI